MSQNPKVRLFNKDWILLVISLAECDAITLVHLQMCLLLVSRKINTGKDFYKFGPGDYGSFAPDILRDAKELEEDRRINIGYDSNLGRKLYSIARAGVRKVEGEIMKGIPRNVIKMIREEIVGCVLDMDFRDLEKEIYK